MPYCECGGGQRKTLYNTVDGLEIGLDVLQLLSDDIPGFGWLIAVLQFEIGYIVNLPIFCALVPPDPPEWTIDLMLSPGDRDIAATQWLNYLLWQHYCECVSTAGTALVEIAWEGAPGTANYATWWEGHEILRWQGAPGHYIVEWQDDSHATWQPGYEGTFVNGIELQYIYPHWACPGGHCGSAEGNHWEFSVYDDLGTQWGVNSKYILGRDANRPKVRISASGCDPTIPPELTPDQPPGYTPSEPPTCSSVADVCARLAGLETSMARLLRQAPAGIAYVTAGAITMEGDDHASIIADAILMTVSGIPVWSSKQGTDEHYYGPWEHPDELGWFAVGNESGWYPPVSVHWETQWVPDLPADATRLTWHLLQGISIAATLFVRSA